MMTKSSVYIWKKCSYAWCFQMISLSVCWKCFLEAIRIVLRLYKIHSYHRVLLATAYESLWFVISLCIVYVYGEIWPKCWVAISDTQTLECGGYQTGELSFQSVLVRPGKVARIVANNSICLQFIKTATYKKYHLRWR